MNTTSISWTEKTWNPVSGCSPISEGCANCYAKRMAQRLRGRCGYPEDEPFRVTLHPNKLDEPLRMRKPSRIFVCSMSDLFHENVPGQFINEIWMTMMNAKKHTFMVLTKRPERLLSWTRTAARAKCWPIEDIWPDHVWLGVTTENQARADERIPILLQVPAAVRFVSCEPLLGPIDLTQAMYGPNPRGMNCFGFTDGCGYEACLQWIIAGGETGPGARPMHPDWVRSLRDQCQVSPTPFHFKSWGEWLPEIEGNTFDELMSGEITCPVCGCTDSRACEGGCYWSVDDNNRDRCSRCAGIKSHEWPDGSYSYRVGAKYSSRLLDDKAWDEYPEARTDA